VKIYTNNFENATRLVFHEMKAKDGLSSLQGGDQSDQVNLQL
jgi:hypothetical protein